MHATLERKSCRGLTSHAVQDFCLWSDGALAKSKSQGIVKATRKLTSAGVIAHRAADAETAEEGAAAAAPKMKSRAKASGCGRRSHTCPRFPSYIMPSRLCFEASHILGWTFWIGPCCCCCVKRGMHLVRSMQVRSPAMDEGLDRVCRRGKFGMNGKFVVGCRTLMQTGRRMHQRRRTRQSRPPAELPANQRRLPRRTPKRAKQPPARKRSQLPRRSLTRQWQWLRWVHAAFYI